MFFSFSLHVSGDYVPIIRRNNYNFIAFSVALLIINLTQPRDF